MSLDSIELHFSGDSYFANAISAIDQAREEVLVESYIFNLDPIGLRLLQALERAKNRGVIVKLLVDGIGSFNWLGPLIDHCEKAEISLRVYHPLPFIRKVRWSWKNLRRGLLFFRRVNQRNHRKVILIDHEFVFMGSFNVSQVHTEEFMGEKAWRDSGVEIRFQPQDPEYRVLRSAFFHTWSKTHLSHLKTAPLRVLNRLRRFKLPGHLFRLNSIAWWRYLLLRDLLRRISRAEKRILITNAYFLPRRSILQALREAAKRGVYVGLCLPRKTDVWFVREASRSLFYRLLKDGVHVFEYQPRILHAKTLVIDDWATVGSHNLNHRSFLHDLEVEAVLIEKKLVEQLIAQWDLDILQSKKMTFTELGRMTILRQSFSRIIYWFRYWL